MEKILISVKAHESVDMDEYLYLLKDENDECYLLKTIHGWIRVSEIQKNWGLLTKYKYHVDKTVVPLIYYILTTNPKQLDNIFEFLYQENFITYEENS